MYICIYRYHMKCLVPPVSKKPPGQWLCPECHTEAEEETRLALEKEAPVLKKSALSWMNTTKCAGAFKFENFCRL